MNWHNFDLIPKEMIATLVFFFSGGILLLTLGVTAFMIGFYSSGPWRWAGIIPGIGMGFMGLLFLGCFSKCAHMVSNDKEDK